MKRSYHKTDKKECFKVHVQQYIDQQLNIYREKYKHDIMACLYSGDLSNKMFDTTEFDTKMMNEFIDIYEAKYPERKQAFSNFFRKADKSFYVHITKIKAMSYMLDEKVIYKMTERMQKRNSIYIRLFSCKNPVPYGASAYVDRDFWGRLRIMYYDVAAKSQLHPPYKTFFHEFGHMLDSLMVKGKGFFSDRFQYTKCAISKKLYYDNSNHRPYIQKVEKVYSKTIHEWAVFDVENYILQTALNLFSSDFPTNDFPAKDCSTNNFPTNGFPAKDCSTNDFSSNTSLNISPYSSRSYLHPAITPCQKYQIIDFTVYHLFLKPDGEKQLKNLSGKPYFHEIRDLYRDVAEYINQIIFANYKNIIVLPKDLFGGITNNQLGGGHNSTYWFKGNKRINQVSREAFAGYFEYKTTIFDSAFQSRLLNPYHCMPNTILALEKMLSVILS